jgi:polyhydroxyalkanoate synthesis regulator phasin
MEDIDRLEPTVVDPDSVEAAQAETRAQQQRSQDEEFSSENALINDTDVVQAQETDNTSEENHEPDMAKAHEMAIVADPYESQKTTIKGLVDSGEMNEKAAQRAIDKLTKRAEKASNKVGEDYESKEKQEARRDEELQDAATDLAAEIADAISMKGPELTLSVEDHSFKAPESLFRKAEYRIPKEQIFQKALDILDIKPEQVQEILKGISAGDINISPYANSTDDLEDYPFSTSRIENPDGSVLDFKYSRHRYSYAPNSGETVQNISPSSLEVSIGHSGHVMTGDPMFDQI